MKRAVMNERIHWWWYDD